MRLRHTAFVYPNTGRRQRSREVRVRVCLIITHQVIVNLIDLFYLFRKYIYKVIDITVTDYLIVMNAILPLQVRALGKTGQDGESDNQRKT